MSTTSRGTVRRLQPGDAGEDQARLFAARDDLDRKAERLRGARPGRRRGCFASRSVCVATARTCDGAKPASRFAKRARQASAAQHRLLGEPAVAVEAGAEPHRLLQVVDAAVAAVLQLADLDPEAVRPDVDGGERAGRRRRRGGSGGRGGGVGQDGRHAGIVAALYDPGAARRLHDDNAAPLFTRARRLRAPFLPRVSLPMAEQAR